MIRDCSHEQQRSAGHLIWAVRFVARRLVACKHEISTGLINPLVQTAGHGNLDYDTTGPCSISGVVKPYKSLLGLSP